MGAGASSVSDLLNKTSDEELKVAVAGLSDAEKAKIVTALAGGEGAGGSRGAGEGSVVVAMDVSGPVKVLLDMCVGRDDAAVRCEKIRAQWAIYKALWQVAVRRCHEEQSANKATFLRLHIGIYRIWGGNQGPGSVWAEAEECFAREDEAAFEVLLASPSNRLATLASKDLRLNAVGETTPFSTDIYSYTDEALAADLHFDNVFVPDSPFRHHDEVIESLRLVAKAMKASPKPVDFLFCVTWLNVFPRFLDLFPPSYRESARPWVDGEPPHGELPHPAEWYKLAHASVGWPPMGVGIMFTGQFLRAGGGLHAEKLDKFIKTGEFPMRCTICVCPAADFLKLYGGEHDVS